MTYLNLNEFQNTVKRPIKNLKALTLLPELRLLKISDQESIIRISDLIGLKNLKELQLPWGCNTIDFTNINHLNSLETIEIGSSGGQGMNINTVNIEEIGGLHNIKRLLIPIRSNVESAGFLSTILSLEELYLFNGSYPDSVFVSDALNDIAYRRRPLDMNIFRNLRNLKYLIMNGFIIKNSGTLNGLQQLELIGIENSSFNSNEDNILINPDILKIPNITIYTGYEH
ncbi:hypothetical protein AGMMS49579_27280 [Spirochaetia bacterium]|nr:hypothetical protein AGMMS49579_27280 [Spirochaetia bacterium]